MNLGLPKTIRSKLTWIVMVTTCTALLFAMVAVSIHDQIAARREMQNQMLTRASIVANNCRAALTFGDETHADEMVGSLSVDPSLGAAVVFDAEGKVFAEYRRPDWRQPPPVPPGYLTAEFHDDLLEVAQPVMADGQQIGCVLLQTDLGALKSGLNRTMLESGLVLVLTVGVGLFLATRLQRFISQPIQELAGTTRCVADQKNYSLRARKRTDDELGQLVDDFNEMLSQIEKRDNALREVQAELEHRVSNRTSELFGVNQSLQSEVEGHKRAREESDALRQRLQSAYENLQSEAERRAAVQEALRLSEQRFSKAFRSSPVPLAILTRDTRMFVDVNDRFVELAGITASEIIGSPMFSIPVWSVPETRDCIERWITDGKPVRNVECRIGNKDGDTRAALLSIESFMIGSERCMMLMTEDISERVNLETQLRQAQKMEAIGQLASGVAHDFNNLLTIIQGYTQLVLAMQPEESSAREPLVKITNATQRATQLTGQLLTFSRKQIPKPKPLDVNQVVDNVTGMLKPLLGENIRLRYHPAKTLPLVEGDSGMLEQVIVNLAVNARDAMAKGGDLVIRTETMDIDESYARFRAQARAGHFVCLQVSDTGCGMDALTLDRIFEPFFTTKELGKGTGLGLATVYGIVKQHDGWIEVASQVGVGTTFKVFLPVIEKTALEGEQVPETGEVRGVGEIIMVVEDEPALRELLISILRGLGYRVMEATHGREALDVWQRAQEKPAMLLTDMMMPEGMTGVELAERLRDEEPQLKVVYTSGYSPDLFGGQLQLNGHANFLPKPFHPRVLASTVRQCLDN